MQIRLLLRRAVFPAVLLSLTCTGIAQGPPDHDRGHPDRDRGHGHHDRDDRDDRGMPPGQAKKYGYSDRAMPPGQAKRYFRDDDRDRFYAHYRYDADRWRGRPRVVFVPGAYIERTYVVRPVPRSYWVGVVAVPPPGYTYGYVNGYVVAWNPTTRVVADVLDLAAAASGH